MKPKFNPTTVQKWRDYLSNQGKELNKWPDFSESESNTVRYLDQVRYQLPDLAIQRWVWALGGGGAKGSFQVGALLYLAKKYDRYRPEALSGTSVGAINSLLIAQDGREGLDRLKDIWLSLQNTRDMYEQSKEVRKLKVVRDILAVPLYKEEEQEKDEKEEKKARKKARRFGLGLLGGLGFSAFAPVTAAIAPAIGPFVGLKLGDLLDKFGALMNADSLYTLGPIQAKMTRHLHAVKMFRTPIELRMVSVAMEDGSLCYVNQKGEFFRQDEDGNFKKSGRQLLQMGSQQLTATSWGNGRVDLFGLDKDGKVLQFFFADGSWRIHLLGNGFQNNRFKSRPTAVSWGPNRIDLLGLGNNEKILHLYWDGRKWHWEQFGHQFKKDFFKGSITAVSRGEGKIDLFGPGRSDRLLQLAINGKKKHWYDLGNGFSNDRFTGGISAASWSKDRVDIFGLGSKNGNLLQASWDGRWHWYDLGDRFSNDRMTGPLAVVSTGEGKLDVFSSSLKSGLLQLQWRNGRWTPRIRGNGFSKGGLTPLAATSWDGGRIDVFGQYKTSSGEVHIRQLYLHNKRWKWADHGNPFPMLEVVKRVTRGALASAAIPLTFEPIVIGNYTLVDGGVRDILPVTTAVATLKDLVKPSHLHREKRGIICIHADKKTLSPWKPGKMGVKLLDLVERAPALMLHEIGLQDNIPLEQASEDFNKIEIAPMVSVHSGTLIDPGLVRINMFYGYMRAYDTIYQYENPKANKWGQAFMTMFANRITELRKEAWKIENRFFSRHNNFDLWLERMRGQIPPNSGTPLQYWRKRYSTRQLVWDTHDLLLLRKIKKEVSTLINGRFDYYKRMDCVLENLGEPDAFYRQNFKQLTRRRNRGRFEECWTHFEFHIWEKDPRRYGNFSPWTEAMDIDGNIIPAERPPRL